MLAKLITTALNYLIEANPATRKELSNIENSVIELSGPLFKLTVQVMNNGKLEATRNVPNCSINFPLASASYWIHRQQIKAFKQININGNHKLATDFLNALAKINPTNTLYLHDSQLVGALALNIELIIKQILDYTSLVTNNMMVSGSEYIQHEANWVTNKYKLEEFYADVDELNERCQLLTKRIEKLMRL